MRVALLLVSILLFAGQHIVYGSMRGAKNWMDSSGKEEARILVHPDDVYWDTNFHYPGLVSNYGASTVYNGTLYTVCYGVGDENENAIVSWSENDGWHIVCTGIPEGVTSIAVDGTNIYLGGSFDEVQGIAAKNIARWNSSQGWMALGAGLEADAHEISIYSLAVTDNGTLYAGGTFTKSGDREVIAIAWWDGLSWEALGNVSAGVCRTIAVEGDNVYTGSFREEVPSAPDGHIIHTLARWDGDAWHEIGENLRGEPSSIVVRNGEIYAAGALMADEEFASECVMYWDGIQWNRLGGNFSHITNSMGTLALTASGNLYVHGSFWEGEMEQFNGVAHWDGIMWQKLGSGIEKGGIRNLQAVGDDVIAIGNPLLQLGGKKTEGIARWRKLTTSVSEQDTSGILTVNCFPNPAAHYASIQFALAQNAHVCISLYNSIGQVVTVICDQSFSAGTYMYSPNITRLDNGLYYYRIYTGHSMITSPLIICR